jgi:hypothetical protein
MMMAGVVVVVAISFLLTSTNMCQLFIGHCPLISMASRPSQPTATQKVLKENTQ